MGSAGGSGATSTALHVVDEEGHESRSVLYSSKAPKNDSSRDVVRRGGVYGCIINTAARSSAERASAAPKCACNIYAIAQKLGFTFYRSDFNFLITFPFTVRYVLCACCADTFEFLFLRLVMAGRGRNGQRGGSRMAGGTRRRRRLGIVRS